MKHNAGNKYTALTIKSVMKNYLLNRVFFLGKSFHSEYLPPASEGWRKVMFLLCTPLQRGYPHPSCWGEGVPPSFPMGWYPHPSWPGVPHPSKWGYPHLADGGYPGLPLGLDGSTPSPIRTGWGYPPLRTGWGHPLGSGLDGGTPVGTRWGLNFTLKTWILNWLLLKLLFY